VRCVERHTGGGIDADEAARLGLPVRDYTPHTLEERIVCHADNLYTGDKRLALREVLAKYDAKGLSHAGRKIEALHASLGRELGIELDALAPLGLPDP
jgi:tRNA (cytidine56-2'-O)-methyltransferase